jgi:hypothetical protein
MFPKSQKFKKGVTMLDVLDLQEWISLLDNKTQRVLMNLCHLGKICQIPLCFMIIKTEGLNQSKIKEQQFPHPN